MDLLLFYHELLYSDNCLHAGTIDIRKQREENKKLIYKKKKCINYARKLCVVCPTFYNNSSYAFEYIMSKKKKK